MRSEDEPDEQGEAERIWWANAVLFDWREMIWCFMLGRILIVWKVMSVLWSFIWW